jgi:hypothetical protein
MSSKRQGNPVLRRLKRVVLGVVRASGYEIVKASNPRFWNRQQSCADQSDERTSDLDAALATIGEHAVSEATAAPIFDKLLRDVVVPHHRSVFWGDRLLTLDKSAGFRDDPRFAAAMRAITGSVQYDQYSSPDGVAWRLNTLVWAAWCGLRVPGDFVECGVYKGDFAWVITQFVDFEKARRTFWLYDTFTGFAPQYSSPDDFPLAPEFFDFANNLYRAAGIYELVCKRFAAQRAVKVIKGTVPDVLRGGAPERIAFLHIDMNSPAPEVASLEILFDRVSPGGVIVFDDYGWLLFRRQKVAEDHFMAERGYEILELPTGQGLVFKR